MHSYVTGNQTLKVASEIFSMKENHQCIEVTKVCSSYPLSYISTSLKSLFSFVFNKLLM